MGDVFVMRAMTRVVARKSLQNPPSDRNRLLDFGIGHDDLEAAGRENEKVAPGPSLDSAHSRP